MPKQVTPDDIATMDHPELLEVYCRLAEVKKDLEARLRDIKANLALADDRLREEYFEPQGLTSVRTKLGTVSIRNDLFVSPADGIDREEAADRLRRSPVFRYLVKPNYNSNSLAAAVREKVREAEDQLADQLLDLTAEERHDRLLHSALGPRLSKAFKLVEKQRLTYSGKKG